MVVARGSPDSIGVDTLGRRGSQRLPSLCILVGTYPLSNSSLWKETPRTVQDESDWAPIKESVSIFV